MSLLKVFVILCLGGLTALLVFKSKLHAEGGATYKEAQVPRENVTLITNETKIERKEEEEKFADDETVENEIVFPTVAPATPQDDSIYPSPFLASSLSRSRMYSVSSEVDHNIYSEKSQTSESSANKETTYSKSEAESKNNEEPNYDNFLPGAPAKSEAGSKSIRESDLMFGVTEEEEILVTEKEDNLNIDAENIISDDLMKLNRKETDDANDNEKEELKQKTDEVNASVSLQKEEKFTENDASPDGILESFKDWKEKQANSKKDVINDKSILQTIQRTRLNKKTNYASNECGAKVVAANQESENAPAILNENKDMYMLNPCSCSIWFVIELCEKIQAETLDIANFELFSSTPDIFKVFFSSRYPTREWQLVGTFHSKPERVIQSFNFEEKFYAKFVKIELVSHFGKEHYCPLSLVRVFGRSEVEELEDSEDHPTEISSDETKINSVHDRDDDSDEKPTEQDKNNPTNFLKSATNAVIGLVNKATKKFTGSLESENKTNGTEDKKETNPVNASEKVTFTAENKEKFNPENKTAIGKKINSTSDLVVLVEGDDGEDEQEMNLTTKKCVFDSEIEGNRCANPSNHFWVPYIFKHKICPLMNQDQEKLKLNNIEINSGVTDIDYVIDGKSKNSIEITSLKESQHAVLNSTTNVNMEDSTIFSSTSDITASNSHHSKAMNGSNYVSKANVSADSVEQSLSKDSLSGVSEHVSQTELARQLLTKKESTSSCTSQTLPSVDVSELLRAAVSVKMQEKESAVEEKFNKQVETVESYNNGDDVDDGKTDNFKAQKEEDGKSEEILSTDKNENGHVDVLVINIDEKLGEGKAEMSEKSVENITRIERLTNNSTTILAPSFSQPSTVNLSSQKTSSTPIAASVISSTSSNQTISDEYAVIPASVRESPEQLQSISIEAISISTPYIEGVRSTTGHYQQNSISPSQLEEGKAKDECSKMKEGCTLEPTVKIGSGSSGNNKESAILKLKSKVKALETNLSLSTLYLEEMSKRYRTALEEQQKLFKLRINALNATILDHKETIETQQQTMAQLAYQVTMLTKQLNNLTNHFNEQERKMSERYAFSCLLEILIIVIILWNCLARSNSVDHHRPRRNSAPSVYYQKNPKDVAVANIQPSENLKEDSIFDSTIVLPVNKRRKQKRRKSQTDENLFSSRIEASTEMVNSRETALVTKTAGVLFSAGRGILSGLTGAFSKQKQPIGSRRTRALIDSNIYEKIKPFGRSKSLTTIEEDEDHQLVLQARPGSYENIRSRKKDKGLDSDKRRG